MNWFGPLHWERLFALDTPVAEIFLRGTIMYLALFLLLRLLLKRQAGTVSITDLLVLVLIADAAQNGMAGDYHSIPDGILLVATIILWNVLLEILSFRFAFIRKITHPPPLLLVEHGKINRAHLRRELITQAELMSQLREQGVNYIGEVKKAYMEGDGNISVLCYEKRPAKKRNKKTL
jgi:uncharacterized membrane protein YcaP (DUF421 family)